MQLRELEMNDSFQLFCSYDTSLWEHSYFSPSSGGFYVTSLARKTFGLLNKQTYEIFQKEQRMCLRFASFGFQIEHLFEVTGISSPDISILRHGPIFRVNGRSADLKSLSSGNNLVKQAKNAIRKKKADLVLFEFTCHNKRIARELNKLPRLGIHGYYYYTDEDTYYVF
jgi:hypothetical protein